MKLLEEKGVDFQKVDYYREPFTKASLKALLKKADLQPRDVLRKRAPQFKEMGLADETVSEATLLAAIVEHPNLLERPIMEVGPRAMLTRPVEKGLRLL